MELPIYASRKEVKRCSAIIKKFLDRINLKYTEAQLESITIDIMNISYSHGGDYSNDIIDGFSEGYFNKQLYLRHL